VEEPEDGGQRTAPSYLYSSLLGVQDSELVLAEVEVINIQLDQELSSNACPGEESGGDDVASKQRRRKRGRDRRKRGDGRTRRSNSRGRRRESERRIEGRRSMLRPCPTPGLIRSLRSRRSSTAQLRSLATCSGRARAVNFC